MNFNGPMLYNCLPLKSPFYIIVCPLSMLSPHDNHRTNKILYIFFTIQPHIIIFYSKNIYTDNQLHLYCKLIATFFFIIWTFNLFKDSYITQDIVHYRREIESIRVYIGQTLCHFPTLPSKRGIQPVEIALVLNGGVLFL